MPTLFVGHREFGLAESFFAAVSSTKFTMVMARSMPVLGAYAFLLVMATNVFLSTVLLR